jgi:hypothetical protein
MKALRIILAGFFAVAMVISAQAKTIRVPGDFPTIQKAMDAAVSGDTVLVAAGTYKGAGNKNLDFKGKAITVTSDKGAALTIIDCEGVGRGFYFHSGETSKSVVSGFTIINGSPGGNLVQIALDPLGSKIVIAEVRKDVFRPKNDGDPAVEPGEIMGLDIALKNKSLNSMGPVKATLKTTDMRVTGLIPVYTGTKITNWKQVDMAGTGIPVDYGTILGNGAKSQFFQFVKINEDFTPLGDRIRFTLDIRSGDSFIGSDEFYVRVGADIILDRIDVDDDLIPGGNPEDIDLRIKNITPGSSQNVRIDLDVKPRNVRIAENRVEFSEILAGRTRAVSFETRIDAGFAGYADFTVTIQVDRKLVNAELFRYYFGMRTHYITRWVTDDNNDNGIAEPGESIRLQIARRNPTETEARDVISTLTTADATIASIGRSSGDYRDVLAYEAKGARRDYEFSVAGTDAFASIPNFSKQGHTVEFTLSTQEDGEFMGTETFTMRIGGMIRYLPPRGYDNLMATISDRKELGVNNNGNGVPESGEIIEMNVTLVNISSENIDSVEAELDSRDDVRFIVDYGNYGEIRKRGRTRSSKYLFKIDDNFEGNKAKFELEIEGRIAGGSRDNLGKDVFTIPVQKREPDLLITEIPASIVSGTIPASSIQVDGYGGGISCINGSSPAIRYNIITRNYAANGGGGIYCGDGSAPAIVNNVITGNSAGTYGGGINCNNGSSPTLVNNTIAGNSAGTNGSGISCRNSSFPTAINVILWGNGTSEIYTDSGSAMDITYSDIKNGWSGTGNINANPRFLNVAINDYHLMDDSPCINAGAQAQAVPDKDMDGNPRPNPEGTKPDMGAYESRLPVLPLSISGVTPSSVDQGVTGKDITVAGTGFQSNAIVSFSSTGVIIKSTTFVSSARLTVKIDVSTNAPAGPRNVIVTNPGGRTVVGENMLYVNTVEATIVRVESAPTAVLGASFAAAIKVENVTELAGYQMGISFDPVILEAVKVDEGGFLKGAGSTYWLQPVIDNAKGKITGIASARTSQGGANGSGTLASVTFKAKTVGNSQVKLENVRLSDVKGTTIPVKLMDSGVNVTGIPPWDVNKDKKVDVTDMVIVGQNFGKTITTPMDPNPDVNGDGVVNVYDFVLVGQHFGEVYGTAAPPRDLWSVDPQHLPTLIKMLNVMDNSPSRETEFLNTRILLQRLISSVRVSRTEVFQNYPNPFNPETWIPFQLSDGSEVEVSIYNSAGKRVKVLNLGFRGAGYYTSQADSARWDGTDESGEKVASGIYFYTIRAGEYAATRKMLLVK